MRATEYARRHLLAMPSWQREELERQARDPFYVHVTDFQKRWRERQEIEHSKQLSEQS